MDKIELKTEGAVLSIIFNSPEHLNALDAQMANELREAIVYAADPANKFRCLMLTGAGRGFCSGGSVSMMDKRRGSSAAEKSAADHLSLGTHHHYIMKKMRDLPYPVITAINGPAAGLGFSYALTGDMIVASRAAFFVSSFRNIGVSPDGGLSWILPRIVGWAKAKELMLLGKRLSADEAMEWGLINRVWDDDQFREQAMALARELANGPTVALGQTRKLLWESWDNSYADHLDREEILQPPTFATEDAIEGATAMLQKRSANFNGR